MVGSVGAAALRVSERSPTVITRAQITRQADRDGIDARTVERDYILAHVVALIALKDAESTLAFKVLAARRNSPEGAHCAHAA